MGNLKIARGKLPLRVENSTGKYGIVTYIFTALRYSL